jgi:hypothetical protein
MFIQVITGTVTDMDGMNEQEERWHRDLRPGAVGFLGSTSGVTDDNRFFVAARFESSEAAAKNSERREQAAWWSDMEKNVSAVSFHDCNRVETFFGGGSNDAGFVQVMQGRVLDADALRRVEQRILEAEDTFRAARPDVIGQVIAYHDDGDTYSDIVYFSSETEARANEQKEMPAELQQLMEELMRAAAIDEYLDLKNPALR